MSSTQTIELQSVESSGIERHESELIEPNEASTSSSLPPTDRGKDAWLFLVACFMLEALIWGKILTPASNWAAS
jgi:hypothetical protein